MNDALSGETVSAELTVQDTPVVESQVSDQAEPTPRGAIDRAFASLETATAPEPVQEQVATERQRDETGRFVAAAKPEGTPAETVQATPEVKATGLPGDAPSRFSPDAKAAWVQTPEPVKAEVQRAFKELEAGIQQYQTRFESLKPYYEIAEHEGTTVESALENYVGLAKELRDNPAEGLQRIFRYVGIDPTDYAKHVLGQPIDPNAQGQAAYIRSLETKLANVEKQIGTVATDIQAQREKEALDQVKATIDAFAKDHPRVHELEESMSKLITSGMASDLPEAYTMAERLNPAPVQPPAGVKTPPATTDQTRKGQLSVSGAPASGSNPANRKPATSTRSALDRAFSMVGVS